MLSHNGFGDKVESDGESGAKNSIALRQTEGSARFR